MQQASLMAEEAPADGEAPRADEGSYAPVVPEAQSVQDLIKRLQSPGTPGSEESPAITPSSKKERARASGLFSLWGSRTAEAPVPSAGPDKRDPELEPAASAPVQPTAEEVQPAFSGAELPEEAASSQQQLAGEMDHALPPSRQAKGGVLAEECHAGEAAAAPAALGVERNLQVPPQRQLPHSPAAESQQTSSSSKLGKRMVHRDWTQWSPEDTANWVESLLGPGAGQVFLEREVDGPTLMGLSDCDLREALSIADPIHRAKLLGHLSVLRNGQELSRGSRQGSGFGGYPAHVPRRPNKGYATTNHGARPAASSDSLSHSLPGSAGSRYSRLLSGRPDLHSLDCYTGLDSPSNSVRGSFGQALREIDHAHPAESPGPAYYDVLKALKQTTKATHSFQATIGRSPKRPSPLTQGALHEPGPLSYNVGENGHIPKKQAPRAVFGSSVRETALIKPLHGSDVSPHSYNAKPVRAKSPQATIGNSPRDTMRCWISHDTKNLGELNAMRRQKSPRAGAALDPPILHAKPLEEFGARGPKATFGKADRDVDTHFMKEQYHVQSPGCIPPAPKIRGGVMTSASRWATTSQGSLHRGDKSPGPCSYRPRVAFLSTFK